MARSRPGSMRTMLALVASHRRLVPITCALIMLVSALTIVVPLLAKLVIESVIPAGATALLDAAFVLFLGFLVLRFGLTLLQDLAVVVLRQKIERSTVEQYLEAVLHLELDRLRAWDAGEIISRLNVLVNDLEWFLCDFIFFVFYALFVFVSLSIVMAAVDPGLFGLVVALVPLHLASFRYFAGRLKDAAQEGQERQGRLSSFVVDSLDGWREVRSYLLRDRFLARNRELVRSLNQAHFVRKGLGLRQKHVQAALILINHVAVLGYGAIAVMEGRTSLGTLFFFLLLLDFFYSPIYRFSAVNEALQAAAVKIARLHELIDAHRLETERCPGAGVVSSRAGQQAGADARQQGRRPVRQLTLQGLTIEGLFADLEHCFTSGRLYFITGPSGCGKTTLLDLLTRFRRPDRGAVLIDGEDTALWPVSRLRSVVQAASQDSELLARSIAANIHLGEPGDPDAERLRRAARLAVADELIERLANGYGHRLEEAGANLSGGQRQRICLARLLYHDAPVMLLDEPTSALDLATERRFFDSLRGVRGDKIILVVNHREESLVYADVVLRLEPGGLVELVPETAGG